MNSKKLILDIYINKKLEVGIGLSIKSVSMKSSISSLYYSAVFTAIIPSFMVENREFAIGTPIELQFYSSDDPSKKIIRNYKVWQFELNNKEGLRSLTGTYTIMCISPWFFTQSAKTKAYLSSVDIILADLAINEQARDFKGIAIAKSKDLMEKTFRINATAGFFIENVLSKRYIVDESPTFIYVDYRQFLNASSYYTLRDSFTDYVFIDTTKIHSDDSIIAEAKRLGKLLPIMGFQYEVNSSGNFWNNANKRIEYLSVLGYSSSGKVGLTGKDKSIFGEGFLPIHPSMDSFKEPLAIDVDDSARPMSIVYGEFLQRQKSVLFDNVLHIGSPTHFDLSIGTSVRVYLKKDSSPSLITGNENSVLASTYVISSIEDTFKNNVLFSNYSLIKDASSPFS